MNNRKREQWIDNDEGLYNWKRSTHLSMRAFIKENRTEIDQVIDNMVSGSRRQHYLVYG